MLLDSKKMSSNNAMLPDYGIIIGIAGTIITSLWAVGKFIYKKGESNKSVIDRLTLIEIRVTKIELDTIIEKAEAKKGQGIIDDKLEQIRNDVAFIKGKLDHT